MHELSWITICLVTSEVICQLFSRVKNHWQITSRVTKKIVIDGNECIILFLTRYFMSWTHNPAKNNCEYWFLPTRWLYIDNNVMELYILYDTYKLIFRCTLFQCSTIYEPVSKWDVLVGRFSRQAYCATKTSTTWWRHQMETFSALLAICAGNSRGALMFSLICTRINGWVNNGEAGDLRRNRAHYDVIVMHHPFKVLYISVCRTTVQNLDSHSEICCRAEIRKLHTFGIMLYSFCWFHNGFITLQISHHVFYGTLRYNMAFKGTIWCFN